MSSQPMAPKASTPDKRTIGFFEKWLTVWVFLCIAAGIVLGQFAPQPMKFIGSLEFAHVNIPVGLLIWLMIVPMLLKVDFSSLHQVRSQWKGIATTLFINWGIKPFSMALATSSRFCHNWLVTLMDACLIFGPDSYSNLFLRCPFPAISAISKSQSDN